MLVIGVLFGLFVVISLCAGAFTFLPEKDEPALVYPVCVLCGQEWPSLGNDQRDLYLTRWCCGPKDKRHHNVWYYSSANGNHSIQMEMHGIGPNGLNYDVRWNCDCMEEDCLGQNVIYDANDDYDHPELGGGELVRFCTWEEMPFDISDEAMWKLIEDAKCSNP